MYGASDSASTTLLKRICNFYSAPENAGIVTATEEAYCKRLPEIDTLDKMFKVLAEVEYELGTYADSNIRATDVRSLYEDMLDAIYLIRKYVPKAILQACIDKVLPIWVSKLE